MQAPAIANGPSIPASVGVPDHDSTTAPTIMQIMPATMRRSKFSWNTNHARSAVATPSSVRRSDAAEASVLARPSIKRSGPTMPPKTIAPVSHGQSRRASGASVPEATRTRVTLRRRPAPTPAPQ